MANEHLERFHHIREYHRQTKHLPHRYAPSPGHLEWATQPHPFRHYQDTPTYRLPLLTDMPDLSYADLFRSTTDSTQAVKTTSVAGFLELSLGLSAWKAVPGSRWSLRINPSSGNLHPTEAHLILPASDQWPAGIYHYDALGHLLARRAKLSSTLTDAFGDAMGNEGFLVILTSIFWRESWKYGARAFRYCNHDIGHALACARFAARLWGWSAKVVATLDDGAMSTLLGLERVKWPELEAEYPQVALWISPRQQISMPAPLSRQLLADFGALKLTGRPNPLSSGHRRWPQIDLVAQQALRDGLFPKDPRVTANGWVDDPAPGLYQQTAATLIRQRRSAVAFDFDGPAISRSVFMAFMARVQYQTDYLPFDLALGPPCIHLLLFVHHVTDLAAGLYLLTRHPKAQVQLKAAMGGHWRWAEEVEMPGLYLLSPGDYRGVARTLSCNQEIAGDSNFALGMLAEFEPLIKSAPYLYRRLFWEAGLIGQILYLEAEAQGLRGTGIGCFFDDLVHDLLELKNDRFQSLYHFTVGHPIEDTRVQALPPYAHLQPPAGF